MGLPGDFKEKTFQRLLANAIFWTAKRKVERKAPVKTGAKDAK